MGAAPQQSFPVRSFSLRLMYAILAVTLVLTNVLSAEGQEYKFLSLPGPQYGFGVNPVGAPVQDQAGNIYGITANENAGFNYRGTILEMTKAGKAKVLYTSNSCDQASNPSGLMIDETGNLYGTSLGCTFGNVFELDTTGTFTVLYVFQGGSDGNWPNGPLIHDSDGNLYGTTQLGGAENGSCPFNCGTVFKLDTAGNETVLYRFQGMPDGQYPENSLTQDSDGNLYGTTAGGGLYGFGTVFKLDASGNETVLYSFQGGADGANPYSNLLRDSAGNLYGTTTEDGGCNGFCGTVFKLDASGTETVLYAFTGGADGASPSVLIADPAGNFYGTTGGSGNANKGVVFKLDPSGNETVLHSFDGKDGSEPWGLLRDNSGNLYGDTYIGGSGGCALHYTDWGCGVFFRIKP